jgi:predicted transcriptional regulator
MKHKRKTGDLKERLLGRIEKDPSTGCWNWIGTFNNCGYGQIAGEIDGVRYAKPKQNMLAHRASYIIYHGPIEDGLIIRHKCDNPACINPDHLEAGTYSDNSTDTVVRMRMNHNPNTGAKHHMAQLTDEQVKQILESDDSYEQLVQKFGVSKVVLQRLKCGHTQYVDEATRKRLKEEAKLRKPPGMPGRSNPMSELTVEQVRYIRTSPKSTYQIADELGVSQAVVSTARRRISYKDVD